MCEGISAERKINKKSTKNTQIQSLKNNMKDFVQQSTAPKQKQNTSALLPPLRDGGKQRLREKGGKNEEAAEQADK